jgi:hypothetical protein
MSTVTHTPLAIWLSRSKFDYTVTYTFAGLGNADGPQLTVTHKTVPGQTIYGPPVTRLLLRTISCVSATTLTCPISLVLPRYPRSKVYCLLACFARWRRLHRYTRLDFRPSGQSGGWRWPNPTGRRDSAASAVTDCRCPRLLGGSPHQQFAVAEFVAPVAVLDRVQVTDRKAGRGGQCPRAGHHGGGLAAIGVMRPVRRVTPPCRHDSTGRSARKCTSDVPAAERTAARFAVPSQRVSEPRLKTDAGRTETVMPLGQPVLNPC